MAKRPSRDRLAPGIGRAAHVEKILSRSEKVLLDPRAMELLRINLPATGQLSSVDAILYELLSPERNRQYGEMMKAINRVCDLISSNKKWC